VAADTPPQPAPTKRRSSLADERERTYLALHRVADVDAVHDLVLRHGPDVLARELPYLIIATRNRLRDSLRQADARQRRETHIAAGSTPATDPAAEVERTWARDRLISALARLSDADVIVLWRHAEGFDDRSVITELEAKGLVDTGLTEVALRKRRQRALERARTLLTDDDARDLL
jgi:hypothetical protein